MISITDVRVALGGTTVLEDASLSVDEGAFLALVGPNGAGKTTLLRTINGLVSPDSGRVTVDGEDVSTLSAGAIGRRVATVPQETSFAFAFDVETLVGMGRTPHRGRFERSDDADSDAVASALERTDTARFADRSVDSLSGGERQRVVLARALAQETPVLLLDEPTASLDIDHQVRTLSLARDLAESGKTVVAAIHDLELAARFCDTVAVLSDGRVLESGSPESVLTAGTLEAAFDVRVAVGTNPVTGTRTVTPLSDVPPDGRRVHVLGRGERTARVLGRLVDAGVEVTVGVLPEGDTALPTARAVASDVVTAPPFEPIPERRVAEAGELVGAADATVVAGPIDDTQDRLVGLGDRVLAIEGVDTPRSVNSVPERDVVEALDDGTHALARSTGRSSSSSS